MKERLLIAHSDAGLYLAELQARFEDMDVKAARSAAELAAILAEWQPDMAYSCVSHEFVRADHRPIIECEDLGWLHVGGSGFEHFAGYDSSRITLTNGRGVLAPFLADTIIGAMIALNHGFFGFHHDQLSGAYQMRTHPALAGQRLLVIGPGAIGQALARKAQALGIEPVAVSRSGAAVEPFASIAGFDRLEDELRLADFVSVHVPRTAETYGLIGPNQFAAMKPSAVFINCARGGVIDEVALCQRLEKGLLRGAYLDVFEQEPLPGDAVLRQCPNLFMTPHCSDMVDDWQIRHARFFMDNLARRQRGEALLNLI